jgi:hypothetical protein
VTYKRFPDSLSPSFSSILYRFCLDLLPSSYLSLSSHLHCAYLDPILGPSLFQLQLPLTPPIRKPNQPVRMAQTPSDQSLTSILGAADKPEPTAAELAAAAELERNREVRITELYRESDRLQEDMAAKKPIDEEECHRLVLVLPDELRDLSLAKDPKLLETMLKSIMDIQVIRRHEIEMLRAFKAKMELILPILLQGHDSGAILPHIHTAEGVANAARISEMERQIKVQAEQLKALQDQANAMQGQGSGVDAQVQQHK